MTRTRPSVSRREYLKTTAVATVGAVGIAGCTGDDTTGTLATRVTDQPGDIGDFESCIVTIAGIWLGPAGAADATEEDSEEREYYEFDTSQQADLVELQDETTQLIDERALPVAAYEFLQLDIDATEGTLESGDTATVETPGEAPLTFNREFEIRENTRTSFTADFTPVRQGQTETYILQPVPDGIRVEYDESEPA